MLFHYRIVAEIHLPVDIKLFHFSKNDYNFKNKSQQHDKSTPNTLFQIESTFGIIFEFFR